MTMEKIENQIDDLLLLIEKGSEEEIRDFLKILHPADIADMLEALEEPARTKVLSLLDTKTASEVLSEIESPYRRDVVKNIVRERLIDIVERMDSDDAADLLGEIPQKEANQILADMATEDGAEISRLMRYPEDSAGGIMQAELVAIPLTATVTEAIETIRKKREEIPDLHTLYVVDKEHRLHGIVPLRKLILAGPQDRIADIMDTNVIAVDVNMDQEDVAKLFRKYDFISMPVIDSNRRLLGRIVVDDIVDVLDEEADEDFLKLAGSLEEEITNLSLKKSVAARFPWLLVTYIGYSISAIVITWFRGAFHDILLFIPFLPMIVGMAGNVGSQSATIIVRGLATGKVDARKVWRVALKEMGAGLALGIIYGTIVGLTTSMREGIFLFGVIVGISMVVVVAMAATLGVLLPIFFHRIGKDPALATAPFITSSIDFLGAAIYYSLAMVLYRV